MTLRQFHWFQVGSTKILGDVLIVGAPGEDQDGEDAGAVYVYKLSASHVYG